MPKPTRPKNLDQTSISPPAAPDAGPVDVTHLQAADLDERQVRGIEHCREAEKSNARVIIISKTQTYWMSKKGNRFWSVIREKRNQRGERGFAYRCSCGDFAKMGRIDCEHIFAERLRRGEVVVDGSISTQRVKQAKAGRRPARKRTGAGGLSVKTLQRHARMTLGDRIPELVVDLKLMLDRTDVKTTRRDKHATSRAVALVLKAAYGLSADEMVPVYRRLIEDGTLRLKKVPHQNTLSRWMNDGRLTPILEQMLGTTSEVFRAMETAAIVDSSKMSQMRSAHARWVEYEDDEREGADWMKMHAIVGVETLVCMAVVFSGVRGVGVTHDSKFICGLVERALVRFTGLRYILADKAYLSEDVVGALWALGLRAVIPIKKRIDVKTKKRFFEAYQNLVEWFDNRQREFHEVYRLRPKIESYFSLVKRVADGYCWSRGRPNKDADNKKRYGGNSNGPCTAWKNETLAKVIYVNLRLTVEHEVRSGYRMNYLTKTFFPEIVEAEKLVA